MRIGLHIGLFTNLTGVAALVGLCGLASLAGLAGPGCRPAQPRFITKNVEGRQIVTRAISPDAYTHATRGFLYVEQGRARAARDAFTRALAHDPDAVTLWEHLAETQLALGNIPAAHQAIKAARALSPTARGYLIEGKVLQARGRPNESESAFQRAFDLAKLEQGASNNTTTDTTLASQAIRVWVESIVLSGRPLEAARKLDAYCQQTPPDANNGQGVWMDLAALHWANGHTDKARQALEQILATDSNHLDALHTLAWLEAAEGNVRAAGMLFDRAQGLLESPKELQSDVARFLTGAGRAADARALLSPPHTLTAEPGVLIEELRLAVDMRAHAHAETVAAYALSAFDEQLTDGQRLSIAQALAATNVRSAQVAAMEELRVIQPGSDAFAAAQRLWAAIEGELGKPAQGLDRLNAAFREPQSLSPAAQHALLTTKIELLAAAGREGDAVKLVVAAQQATEEGDDEANLTNNHDVELALSVASLEAQRGNVQAALNHAEAALRRHPDSPDLLNFWGYTVAEHAADNGPDIARDLERDLAKAQAALPPPRHSCPEPAPFWTAWAGYI